VHLYNRIVAAKLFIDDNFAECVSGKRIAAEACLSEFHFLRLFRQIYQLTPHQYLTAIRIRKAKELLRNGHLSTRTCSLVGFKSMSSFIKLFRRHVKMMPSDFVSKIRSQDNDIQIHPLKHIPQCFVEYMHWNK
jgi:AraC-like DNA-binding protein